MSLYVFYTKEPLVTAVAENPMEMNVPGMINDRQLVSCFANSVEEVMDGYKYITNQKQLISNKAIIKVGEDTFNNRSELGIVESALKQLMVKASDGIGWYVTRTTERNYTWLNYVMVSKINIIAFGNCGDVDLIDNDAFVKLICTKNYLNFDNLKSTDVTQIDYTGVDASEAFVSINAAGVFISNTINVLLIGMDIPFCVAKEVVRKLTRTYDRGTGKVPAWSIFGYDQNGYTYVSRSKKFGKESIEMEVIE